MSDDLLGTAARFAGQVLFDLAHRASRFSRTLSPRELKEDFARWDKPHYPSSVGVCLICGQEGVTYDSRVRCPGTAAQQRAREELARGDDELHHS